MFAVIGEDGYKYKEKFDMKTDVYHTEGISAVGFSHCECTKCKATVKGGNGYSGLEGLSHDLAKGGDAIGFFNSSIIDRECKTTGGRGGNGENASGYTNYQSGNGFRGGNGGHGGSGAGSKFFKSGDGGYGGNGGSAYVYKVENGTTGKGGERGRAGTAYIR